MGGKINTKLLPGTEAMYKSSTFLTGSFNELSIGNRALLEEHTKGNMPLKCVYII